MVYISIYSLIYKNNIVYSANYDVSAIIEYI